MVEKTYLIVDLKFFFLGDGSNDQLVAKDNRRILDIYVITFRFI